MVKWTGKRTEKLKVLTTGPSKTQYQYNLSANSKYETFPFSDGNGKYTIGIYKNVKGTSYSTVLSLSITVNMKDEFAPFLRPNQYISFTDKSKVVTKAKGLCAKSRTNLDKTKAVYEYVVKNVKYDKQKAATVKSGYLPDVDKTLSTGKGICFDYAALMTAMLRSQGVPCKLVVGYTGKAYHAWISVYSKDKGWMDSTIYFDGNKWKLMDPTFASSNKQSAAIMKYIGDGKNYQAKYQY